MAEPALRSVAEAIQAVSRESNLLDPIRSHHNKGPGRLPVGLSFRGQRSAAWELEPAIFREMRDRQLSDITEHTVFVEFQRSEAAKLGASQCTLDCLCLMQHYGIPTRTLDWSASILTALYFSSLDDAETNHEDGAVFVLNAFGLNKVSTGYPVIHLPESGPVEGRAWMACDPFLHRVLAHFQNTRPSFREEIEAGFNARNPSKAEFKKQCRLPVAVIPNMLTQRMKAQESILVIHGGTHRTSSSAEIFGAPILVSDVDPTVVMKLRIPAIAKARIRDELDRIGVNRASLFPELEHQARYIWDRQIARDIPKLKDGSAGDIVPGGPEWFQTHGF